MPMDEYDTSHGTKYDKIINVYRNSNINEIINNITQNMSPNHRVIYLSEDIKQTINSLRKVLDVVDKRQITCVSARILHSYEADKIWYCEWYLANVWRGNDDIEQ